MDLQHYQREMNVMKCLMTNHTDIEAKARADLPPTKTMLSRFERDPNCKYNPALRGLIQAASAGQRQGRVS